MPLKHIHDVSLSWLGTGNNVWMIPAGTNSSSEEVVIVIKKKPVSNLVCMARFWNNL